MLEAWSDSKTRAKNLDKVNTEYARETQLAQRNNSREAIAAISGGPRSRLLEQLEGQLRFFDSHLAQPPEALSEHNRKALFSTVHALVDTFGPTSYLAVYREWKAAQARATQKPPAQT